MWNKYLGDAPPAGKLSWANGYQQSLSEQKEIIKWDYTGVWQPSLFFLNDSVTRKCALIEFARGTKLGEAANRLKHMPTFIMTLSSWGNILGKAECSFSKMQIPEVKEIWESTEKNCGDAEIPSPPANAFPVEQMGEAMCTWCSSPCPVINSKTVISCCALLQGEDRFLSVVLTKQLCKHLLALVHERCSKHLNEF